MMRAHPRIGYDILKGSPSKYLSMGAIIALGHHEKFDGTGYPEWTPWRGHSGRRASRRGRRRLRRARERAAVQACVAGARGNRLPQGAARQALRPEIRRRLPGRPDAGRRDLYGVCGLRLPEFAAAAATPAGVEMGQTGI